MPCVPSTPCFGTTKRALETAEMSYNQAVSDYDSADGRRDLANADLQAASAAWSSSTRDRQKAVEDSLDARVGLRLFDEEMRRLDKEERDE